MVQAYVYTKYLASIVDYLSSAYFTYQGVMLLLVVSRLPGLAMLSICLRRWLMGQVTAEIIWN